MPSPCRTALKGSANTAVRPAIIMNLTAADCKPLAGMEQLLPASVKLSFSSADFHTTAMKLLSTEKKTLTTTLKC